jgi:hypothetical protein
MAPSLGYLLGRPDLMTGDLQAVHQGVQGILI